MLLAFSKCPAVASSRLSKPPHFLAQHLDSSRSRGPIRRSQSRGRLLCRKKDAAGLQHFDKAIEVLEKAIAVRPDTVITWTMSIVLRIEGLPSSRPAGRSKGDRLVRDEAFMKAEHFDDSIAWLYHYCVTRLWGPDKRRKRLPSAMRILPPRTKYYSAGRDTLAANRDQARRPLARLAGSPYRTWAAYALVKGTEGTNLLLLRMAAMRRTYGWHSALTPITGRPWCTGTMARMPQQLRPRPTESVAWLPRTTPYTSAPRRAVQARRQRRASEVLSV